MNATKLVKKITMMMIVFGSAIVLKAQNEESNFSISGSVDTYYRVNFSGSNDASSGLTTAPGTSFANLPGFSLGMVNIVGAYEGESAGVVADLVYGPRGVDAVFASPAPLNVVNQLYVYWNATEALTFTLGNFNTFLGYEVISPTGNFNYSTSYMFSYGPFSHTGLKADLALPGGFSLMLAVMNPTDATDFNPTNDYVGGGQLGYENDMGGAWFNTIISDGFYQVDLTTGWDVTSSVYLGFNATSNSDFYGAALYAQTSITDAFALGVRGEYFADESGVVLTAGESVIDLTISANYTVGALTFIPEFRIDATSDDEFMLSGDVQDPASIEYGNTFSSFVLGAYFAF